MIHPSGVHLPTCDPCPFCDYVADTRPCAFVTRSPHVAAIVNIRQYERGGMLVIPTDHRPTVFDLEADLLAAVYAEAARVGAAALRAFGATGLNIFQNNGTHAGQSFRTITFTWYRGTRPASGRGSFTKPTSRRCPWRSRS